jgi:hypothetical protein
MSQQQPWSEWATVGARHMPSLYKPQATALAAFSLGVARARRCTLSRVAEALAGLGTPDTVARRLPRFVHNRHLDWQACLPPLATWVVRSLVATRIIVLLVDETSLQEHLTVMAVSLAYHGRAIPLAWWGDRPEAWPMVQADRIMRLRHGSAPGLPPGCRVLVQADRGLGTSPALLQAIAAPG